MDWDDGLSFSIRKQIEYFIHLIANTYAGNGYSCDEAISDSLNRIVYLMKKNNNAAFGIEAPILPIELNIFSPIGMAELDLTTNYPKLIDLTIKHTFSYS